MSALQARSTRTAGRQAHRAAHCERVRTLFFFFFLKWQTVRRLGTFKFRNGPIVLPFRSDLIDCTRRQRMQCVDVTTLL